MCNELYFLTKGDIDNEDAIYLSIPTSLLNF